MAVAHAGILSKGITLKMDNTLVENLQEIPDLGGGADTVDVTTLADDNYHYINGIKDFGSLEFTFLYDNSAVTSNYRVCRAAEEDGQAHTFEVAFPDGTKFGFSGQVSTTITGAGVNAAMQFTLTVNLNSDLVVTMPQ